MKTASDYRMAPTINEIVGVREERKSRRNRVPAWTKFKKNDIVQFSFNGLTRVGRVTTIVSTGLTILYNIATPTGQWFKGVEQSRIISKQETSTTAYYGKY